MLIGARTAAWLPYDAEVEYLESSGTQKIDTGYTCGAPSSFLIETDIAITKGDGSTYGLFLTRSANSCLIGAMTASLRMLSYAFTTGASQISYFADLVTGQKYNYKVGFTGAKSYAILDGVEHSYANSTSKAITSSIKLFNDDGSYYGYCRFYNWKFTVNGSVVRDMIPVRVGKVGYMYDRVSRKLFGNAGTGAFIVGPVKT